MTSFKTVWIAALSSMPLPNSSSSLSPIQLRESAKTVFMAMRGPETDCPDPTARNSKRFPVKAKGEVRLRSPGSVGKMGRVSTPIFINPLPLEPVAPPLLI